MHIYSEAYSGLSTKGVPTDSQREIMDRWHNGEMSTVEMRQLIAAAREA